MKIRMKGEPAAARKKKGYIDNQLPPIIIGLLLMVGAVRYIMIPENLTEMSSLRGGLILLFSVPFFVFGFWSNWVSVTSPESPFNKHMSPFFLGGLVVGALGYGAWCFYSTHLKVLVYFFVPAAVFVAGLSIYLETVRLKDIGGEPPRGSTEP